MSASYTFLDYWDESRSSEDTLLGTEDCPIKGPHAVGFRTPPRRKRHGLCVSCIASRSPTSSDNKSLQLAFLIFAVACLLGALGLLLYVVSDSADIVSPLFFRNQ